MSSKSLYISDFRLCDWDHFLLVKGLAILLMLVAEVLDTFYGMEHLLILENVTAAVFLLCSGYGISESYRAKNGMPHYWENKVVKLWIPSLVVLILMSLIQGGNGVIWIEQYPTALYGWFMYLLFGSYAVFWLAFRLAENRTTRMIVLFAAAFAAMLILNDRQITQHALCFPVGVMFSQLRGKYAVRDMNWVKRLLLILALAAVAVPCWIFRDSIANFRLNNAVHTLAWISTGSILILGMYFVRKLKIWGVFAPFGLIAYPMFLLHTGILKVVGRGKNDWRTVLLSVAVLLVASGVYSWLIELLVSWNKYNRRKKQTHLKGSMW